jgi:hypothetical protein
MKTTKLLSCAVALTLAFASGKAHAQNLTETFIGIDPGLAVQGTFTGSVSTNEVVSGISKFATFEAFCVEPMQSIGYGETLVYQIQDTNTLVESATIARLVGGYLQSSRTARDAAAVQWAIWETVAETSLPDSLADGNVRIDSAVNQDTLALANFYLANVNSYTAASLTYLKNDTRQDMVTWNVVPEPGSLALGLVSGLMLLRRKRR